MRRLVSALVLALVILLPGGPALAVDSPTPSPTTTTPPPTEPSPGPPGPTDGIRQVPVEDEGADLYSVATILLFFAIASAVLVAIIRIGMRSADGED
ncbi:hypothetical protein GCM10009821_02500 [Aeromicrobium halocynthiae]|uniref:Uncharacterized protein n=1 Tax=Aeromicrobium halocynthiae TaxID=560557 RepID=A0ABN2VR99_9ACTN